MSDFQQRLQQALGDDYAIERELGGAGMSRVFVATERSLQRRVVVKVLPSDLAAGVNGERFRREIQLAAQLQHPHIVPLLAAGEQDDLLWYTMPFIEGESLRVALLRHGRMSARDVVRILHDVVDALAYAHARGVVHRDIKPGNILTSGMHAMVTDFGVAKALSASIPVHDGGTTAGMAIGTPAYMAPEQLAADPAADHRVDIYATGLLAYELLTGASPFGGQSPQATLAAQLTQMPEPPHRTLPDVPEALSAIIMRCLEKDASRRFATASDLLAALEALPPMPSGATAARRPSAVPRWPVAAGLLVALASAAFAVTHRTRTAGVADGAAAGGTITPRDAGPGGALDPSAGVTARTGGGADVAPTVVSGGIVRVDTVVVYRDLIDVPDGRRPTTVPVIITRAESIAIAAAMQRRGAATPAADASGGTGATPPASGTGSTAAPRPSPATPPGTRVFVRSGEAGMVVSSTADSVARRETRDAWVAEIRRVFSDSMARALAQADSAMARQPRIMRFDDGRPGAPSVVTPIVGPPAPGRVRVVVTPFLNRTRRPDLDSLGGAAARLLRAELGARPATEVVDEETTARTYELLGDRMATGWSLRADYVVSGVYLLRGDSLAVVTFFTDVRRGHQSRGAETVLPLADAQRAFGASTARVIAWLDSARAAAPGLPSPRPPGAPGRRGSEQGPRRGDNATDPRG
jgi:serine/threonine-protein kinase